MVDEDVPYLFLSNINKYYEREHLLPRNLKIELLPLSTIQTSEFEDYFNVHYITKSYVDKIKKKGKLKVARISLIKDPPSNLLNILNMSISNERSISRRQSIDMDSLKRTTSPINTNEETIYCEQQKIFNVFDILISITSKSVDPEMYKYIKLLKPVESYFTRTKITSKINSTRDLRIPPIERNLYRGINQYIKTIEPFKTRGSIFKSKKKVNTIGGLKKNNKTIKNK
jgi:hypothetical protein